MTSHETLLLTRADVAALLSPEDCEAAVERAFLLHGRGKAPPPASLGVAGNGGGFHVKAAALDLGRSYFAAKVNGNFPDNPRDRGLPAIQGAIVLCDASDGRPLAILDSIEITILRTAAATAVAARHLARPESAVLTVAGCGNQGRAHLEALARALPLRKVFAWDRDPAAARRLAETTGRAGLEIMPAADLGGAVRESDVVVTCTPSREPYLLREDLRPGTFVAAVGADNPEKRELRPGFLSAATLVVDSREQCAQGGELHHALREGSFAGAPEPAELAEVVAGVRPGRVGPEEITVFDSTGVALEDVAAAAAVFEKAVAEGRGARLALGG
jgi:ornithine cyclodeaminase/alanine dehydrogenase-like protein (mu-crystallin family)